MFKTVGAATLGLGGDRGSIFQMFLDLAQQDRTYIDKFVQKQIKIRIKDSDA